MTRALEIHTLGGLAIRLQGQELTAFASRKVEALLVYLACTARPRSREVLAELLWEERSQSQGLSNLRVALSSLRKQLAPFLLVSREQVGLNPEADVWLDVSELDCRWAAVRELCLPATPEAVDQVKNALALYRGDFLEGFYLRESSGFEDWMVLERERVRAVQEQLAQWLLEALLAVESWREAIEWAERWIALGQTPEPAYRALMHAYAGLGDAGNVTEAYQRCVQALASDLGVEPTGQTRRAYAECLKGPPTAGKAAPRPLPRAPVEPDSPLRALLLQAKKRGDTILNLPSLAAAYSSRHELAFDAEEVGLLLRSALHHGQDAGPWLRRAASPAVAAQALEEAWKLYPRPEVRLRVVELLADLPGDEATGALLRVLAAEDAPDVRTCAALAASARGHRGQVVASLAGDLGTTREPGAMAALVAIADEQGLPEDSPPFPRLPLLAWLGHRRWEVHRGTIMRQTGRAALGAALAWGFFGLSTPLYSALASPEEYRQTLEQIGSVSAWMLASALMALVVGGALGAAEGFSVGLADALWKGRPRGRWRLAFGGLAGLVHALYLILFTAAGAFAPSAPAGLVTPLYLAYGVLQGMVATVAVPRLGEPAPFPRQLRRSAAASLAAAALTVPFVYLVYPGQVEVSLFSKLVNAGLLVLGMGLALSRRRPAHLPVQPLPE